jgi:hypothetical protein
LNARMFARRLAVSLLGRLGRRSHKSGCWISLFERSKGALPEIGGILAPPFWLSSAWSDLFRSFTAASGGGPDG